jgi:hypothetical protein
MLVNFMIAVRKAGECFYEQLKGKISIMREILFLTLRFEDSIRLTVADVNTVAASSFKRYSCMRNKDLPNLLWRRLLFTESMTQVISSTIKNTP